MTVDQLVVERAIRASIDDVWSAWTTEAGLASWWWSGWRDTTYDVNAFVGGTYKVTVPSIGIGVSGQFLAIVPPHHLEMTWTWEDDEGTGPVEHVTIDLSSDGSLTTVRVRHTGPWTTPEPSANYLQGWNDVLDSLTRFAAPA